jgi:hypothetical protein
VIFFIELSFTNFFLEEGLCVLPYHGVDNLSPLMPHWLIRSRSYACTINLYTSDCRIWWLWCPGWSHLPVAKSVMKNFMCFC